MSKRPECEKVLLKKKQKERKVIWFPAFTGAEKTEQLGVTRMTLERVAYVCCERHTSLDFCATAGVVPEG